MIYLLTVSFSNSFTVVAMTPWEHVDLRSADERVVIDIVDEMKHNTAWSGQLFVDFAKLFIEIDGSLYGWKEWDLR